jgi:AraC family transcriptional regulator of adaptative response/methylated-DNA-[protein]-cysteine methyltransferase
MKNTILPPETIMYDALINKDGSYDGIFFAAVKTTGIFCRPTCTARKPKRENVDFYASTKDALFAGYRPCKICNPLEYNGKAPAWINELLKQIDENPERRWNDFSLHEINLDPNRVRRWFKKNHNMTFHAYLRSIRLGRAIGNIRQGANITQTAYSYGFESVSGFNVAVKKLVGLSPSKSKQQTTLLITRILSPLGPMVAGATKNGLCLLEFADRRMLETQFKRMVKLLNCHIVIGENEHIQSIDSELKKYFDGTLKKFETKIELPGTTFQKSVWNELMKIPYASTSTYKRIADQINNTNAVRAVATANGDNRLAIIIPCHRVIGEDGKLHGYGGGLWRKKWLLEHETNQINYE